MKFHLEIDCDLTEPRQLLLPVVASMLVRLASDVMRHQGEPEDYIVILRDDGANPIGRAEFE